MWDYYSLMMKVDRLVGGLPKHPEIVRRWQEAKWPTNPEAKLGNGDPATPEEAAARTVQDLGSQALAAEEAVAGIWTGFAERDGVLVIEERQVRAMLKESANIVKALPSMRKVNRAGDAKEVPLRARLAERVFVRPHWIPLGVSEPTESPERPIHVMTALGPRTALKRADVIDDVEIHCTLKVLNDGFITEAILCTILDHACENGLGTDRSQGNGTFDYVLTKLPPEG
jgi:hypothetical protein